MKWSVIAAVCISLFGVIGNVNGQDAQPTPLTLTPTSQPTAPGYESVTTPAPRRDASPNWRYPESSQTVIVTHPRETLFPGNSFEFTLDAEGFTSWGDRHAETIVFVDAGFRYYFVRNLAVGLELGIAPGTFGRHHHDSNDDDDRDGVRAVETLFDFRWNFISGRHASVFLDAGLGWMYASHDFPTGNRRDSLIGVIGLGMNVRVTPNCFLELGGRYASLSSSRQDSYSNNDGYYYHHHYREFDGVQYFGGLSFLW